MGCSVTGELHVFETWVGDLLAKLTPAARRHATRDVARELRRSQQRRIAAQKSPDGRDYAPRKLPPRSGGRRLRETRGRLKRAAMFAKLRSARYLQLEADTNGFAIGFAGRVARIARVHQFGETARVAPRGPRYRYPVRMLLGLSASEQGMVRDRLLMHIQR